MVLSCSVIFEYLDCRLLDLLTGKVLCDKLIRILNEFLSKLLMVLEVCNSLDEIR